MAQSTQNRIDTLEKAVLSMHADLKKALSDISTLKRELARVTDLLSESDAAAKESAAEVVRLSKLQVSGSPSSQESRALVERCRSQVLTDVKHMMGPVIRDIKKDIQTTKVAVEAQRSFISCELFPGEEAVDAYRRGVAAQHEPQRAITDGKATDARVISAHVSTFFSEDD